MLLGGVPSAAGEDASLTVSPLSRQPMGLFAQTGFSTKAKLEYLFVTPGRLCGVNGTPNASPGRLVMRAL